MYVHIVHTMYLSSDHIPPLFKKFDLHSIHHLLLLLLPRLSILCPLYLSQGIDSIENSKKKIKSIEEKEREKKGTLLFQKKKKRKKKIGRSFFLILKILSFFDTNFTYS